MVSGLVTVLCPAQLFRAISTWAVTALKEPLSFPLLPNPAEGGHDGTTPWAASSTMSLHELVSTSLNCSRRRSDILDILAGIPHEFVPRDFGELSTLLTQLPSLAKAVVTANESAAGSALDQDLREVLRRLLAPDAPAPLRQRLLASLAERVACAELPVPVDLALDRSRTSAGATSSGLVHRGLVRLGALTGLPQLRQRQEMLRSHAAEVLLRSERPAVGECFAFTTNATVTLRVEPPAHISHLVIEQPPRWSTPRPGSSPRQFEVWGRSGVQEGLELLGNFEYQLAAPASQTFFLKAEVQTDLLVLNFVAPNWNEAFSCLYRVRAFKDPTRACSSCDCTPGAGM